MPRKKHALGAKCLKNGGTDRRFIDSHSIYTFYFHNCPRFAFDDVKNCSVSSIYLVSICI